ncbi:MAG: alpha/beta fold hydrolase [Ruminococcus sp.]|nr:alpha/beta fold hydrolase [Ruminococcus sp.]
MKKSLLSFFIATMLTLSACTSVADKEKMPDTTPTESATEAITEIPTEEATEAPTANKINDLSDTEKRIVCYVEGQKISGVMHLPEGDGPFPTVVMIGGMGMTYTYYGSMAKKIAQGGAAAVTFDCRGYVPNGYFSEGDFYNDMSPESCVTDILAVTDFISEYPAIDKDNIFLWGQSYGGLVTTMAAAESPDSFKGIIGVDPSYQMPDEARSQFDDETKEFIYRDGADSKIGEPLARGLMAVDIFEKMKLFNGNAIILTGTNETINVIYPEVFDKALTSYPNAEKVVVEGANHRFSDHMKELVELTVDFVKNKSN